MILSSTSVMFMTWSSLIAAHLQPAPQNILERECPQVADVDVVVDRRPARVHAHDVAVQRSKRLHLLGKSVVEAQRHPGVILHGNP